MKMLVKISSRLVLIVGVLLATNYIYVAYFFEKDIQKNSPIINLVRSVPQNTDILYVGESSNITYSSMDADKRSISQFIGDFYPSLTTSDITKEATHSGIYKTLLANLSTSNEVKTVVVTLNLRSFNSAWINSTLETPLQKSMVLLQDYPPLVNRFLLSFKAYDIKSDAERKSDMISKWKKDQLIFPFVFPHKNVFDWDNWMADQIYSPTNKLSIDTIDLACHYIKSYAFQIDTNSNPRIQDFNEIVELARKRNWNLVFNLMAENTEKAELLVGKELTYLMKANRDLLVKYYTKKGVTVVDNLTAVGKDDYIDQNWTTEHYTENGRQKIATNVANAIQGFHESAFEDCDFTRFQKSSFFNNCEGTTKWSNEQTITNIDAYSGKWCSKTDKRDEYSITFEYPYDNIPDSLKNTVSISMMVKSKKYSEKAAIILEVMGAHKKQLWQSAALDQLTTESREWQTIKHTFELPQHVRKGELVKLYLLNLSGEEVFLDDFSIEFN